MERKQLSRLDRAKGSRPALQRSHPEAGLLRDAWLRISAPRGRSRASPGANPPGLSLAPWLTWLLDIKDGFPAGVLIILEPYHTVVLILVGAVHRVFTRVTCGGRRRGRQPKPCPPGGVNRCCPAGQTVKLRPGLRVPPEALSKRGRRSSLCWARAQAKTGAEPCPEIPKPHLSTGVITESPGPAAQSDRCCVGTRIPALAGCV